MRDRFLLPGRIKLAIPSGVRDGEAPEMRPSAMLPAYAGRPDPPRRRSVEQRPPEPQSVWPREDQA
jgi:hypothetical protein